MEHETGLLHTPAPTKRIDSQYVPVCRNGNVQHFGVGVNDSERVFIGLLLRKLR